MLGWLWQGLIQRSSAAMVRISEMSKCGPTWSRRRSTARIASTAFCRGTKYSDWSSLPALGVKPMRKWGSRSYHVPGTPICSVQFSAERAAIGWRLVVARFAPKNSGGASKGFPSSMRLFSQTSLKLCFCQSVNRLTLYARDVMASKWSFSSLSGRFSYTYCRIM